jgi:hypothetical protein
LGFKDLRRLICDMTNRQQETGGKLSTAEYLERQEAKTILEQLRTQHNIAYNRRKDKWLENNQGQQYFSPTLDETRRDCRLEEWVWYFIYRIFSRTPEQRYQDERTPDYGWNHISDIHGIIEPCLEGCRFRSEEGRIEDIEVLKDYEKFDRYNEVKGIWTAGETAATTK